MKPTSACFPCLQQPPLTSTNQLCGLCRSYHAKSSLNQEFPMTLAQLLGMRILLLFGNSVEKKQKYDIPGAISSVQHTISETIGMFLNDFILIYAGILLHVMYVSIQFSIMCILCASSLYMVVIKTYKCRYKLSYVQSQVYSLMGPLQGWLSTFCTFWNTKKKSQYFAM